MKKLIEFIKKLLKRNKNLQEIIVIDKKAILDGKKRSVHIHGIDPKEPHIHICGRNFNFEISLVDLICQNKSVLIKMFDKKNKINKKRKKCSWNGYFKMKRDFEEWLECPEVKIEGNYRNNLDALIVSYNKLTKNRTHNPILKYLSDRNLKVHENHRYLFRKIDLEIYDV